MLLTLMLTATPFRGLSLFARVAHSGRTLQGSRFCDNCFEAAASSNNAYVAALDPWTMPCFQVICDSYHGLPLNSPNDVVVARDGAAWFTDPIYGKLEKVCNPPSLLSPPSSW